MYYGGHATPKCMTTPVNGKKVEGINKARIELKKMRIRSKAINPKAKQDAWIIIF